MEKNLEIKNNIHDNIIVHADKFRISELIINLLSNATKYTNYLALDEYCNFDTSRHDFSSSGLGLSICKHIVGKHHGKIRVVSESPGKCSTFIL